MLHPEHRPSPSALSAWRVVSLASALACGLTLSPSAFAAHAARPAKAPTVAAEASARAPRGSLQPVGMVEGIREYRLPNGLQVLLNPDDSKPTTTVNMTYRVGSRHESYGETGMAHLLEHLLFKGSPRHPQVWAEFNKRGFSANGSTWYDRTNYFASFAANEDNLQWYLRWQADAMVNSFIARKDLDSEMTVVRNEMEMGENDPGRVLMEKTLSAMYQWHNYGKSTIGARTDVEGVDISRLQAFYKRHYQPDNATLIISGKFDAAKVLAWVQQAFAAVPKPQRALPPLYTLDPVQDGERSVTLRRVGGTPLLFAGYHVMPGAHPDYAAVSLLTTILGDSPSGRLHKQLVDKQLAASVFSFSEGLADPGFILLGAQLGAQQDADAAAKALLAAGESFAQQPVTAEELARARAKWLKDWDAGFADPQHVGVALSESVAQGDWRLYFLMRDRVKAIQLADVQRVAQRYFVTANRTLAQYVPTPQPVRAPAPQRVDVTAELKGFEGQAAQAQAEVFEATPANIDARTQRFALPSGMKVALLPKTTRGQAVKATLTLRFGTAESLAGWGEVPSALAALLDKGTAQLSRQQVQDRLDALQSDVAFSAGPGQLNVALSSRREHLPALMALVSDLLQQPSLPADVLEEVRSQALAGIEAQRKEPEAVLAEAMSRHGDPYPLGDVRHARSFDETVADWQAVKAERVKDFHQRFVSAVNAQFSAVGDFDAAAVRAALTQGLGAWRKPEASAEPFARIPDPLVPVPAVRLVLSTPDKQNATMSVQQALPLSDRDADYPALMLANHLLGGGGDSRLWNRIRERDGLSYSVYSSIQWHPQEAHSAWATTAIFAPQNRDKVETAFREEIERALKQGFTQAEFESGKRGLLSFRRLGRAQDARLAAGWVSNLYLDRDFAVSARVDAQLEALTLAQVNAALRRHLQPAQFVFGFAGDFK
ncbi:zinc protease [Aquabacterium commune]|uniref:Zinc protease n=1 Tax=Aquabacterium commune TaxID=70586 RepID=A0A4R6R822_9BURK|nr:pitrilysin family protein [Aquabacterium commune]TDP82160.1 zinc protease [Aquabacterium commune]